jgi:Family of unknown function (DUF5908)
MPVEIKELVVRANVSGSNQQGDASRTTNDDGASAGETKLSFRQKKDIVDECVSQIMDLLEKKAKY